MTFSDSNLIIVGGAPRSGTTLLQRIIAAHPEIYGGPEFDKLPAIARLWRDFENSYDNGRIKAFFQENEIERAFRKFIFNLFENKFNREKVLFFSEKTPSNILVFEELMTLLPRAKFIFVIRNPYDIAASMLEVGNRYRKEKKKAPSFCRNIFCAVDCIKDYWRKGFDADKENPNKVLKIFYEDILSNPVPIIKSLCEFIGVNESNVMLAIENDDFEGKQAAHTFTAWYSQDALNKGILKQGATDRQRKLSKWERHVVTWYLAEFDSQTSRYFDANLSRPSLGLRFILNMVGLIYRCGTLFDDLMYKIMYRLRIVQSS